MNRSLKPLSRILYSYLAISMWSGSVRGELSLTGVAVALIQLTRVTQEDVVSEVAR